MAFDMIRKLLSFGASGVPQTNSSLDVEFVTGSKPSQAQPEPSTTSDDSWSASTAAASVAAYKRPPRFEALTREVTDRSHPLFPWLSNRYSPASRIPCCDLTPTFVTLLREGDRATISDILRHTLVANPGIGFGSGLQAGAWINQVVDQFAELDYEQYIGFADPEAFTRLRAFALVASLIAGKGEFYLVDRTLEFVAMAFAIELPRVKPPISILVERGNRFIRQMKAEKVPFWLDYPLISKSHVFAEAPDPLPNREHVELFRKLPLLTRIVLLELHRRGTGTVEQATTYALRVLGTDAAESLGILTRSHIARVIEDPTIPLMTRTKADLLEHAASAGVAFKRSHTKPRIIAAMLESAPALVAQLAEDQPVYEVQPKYRETMDDWDAHARHVMPLFEALAFAHAERYESRR